MPAATARAIRDGYFHTGDAAVVHPDGYAEIRDRIKDVFTFINELPKTATGKVQKYVLRGGCSSISVQ